jgi:hypothetical protein
LPAIAAIGFAMPPAWAGDVLLQIDNDKVVDTDRHYTNGMRLAYTQTPPPGPPSKLLRYGTSLGELVRFKDTQNLRVGWAIGQEMYTPENVDIYTPDPLDRPYAGWTYLGLTTQNLSPADNRTQASFLDGFDRQDSFELDVGIIGPTSKAAQLHNAFHRLINVSVSRGWRSQIHNEPGILATRIIKLRSQAKPIANLEWLNYDFISHGSAHLGNVKTAITAGMTARLGANLKEDFGPIYGTFALPQAKPNNNSLAFFIGFDAKAVAQDIFLDGNSFQNSPDVKKNPFVLESRLGVSSNILMPKLLGDKNLHVSLAMVSRTREFKTQDKADRYGSVQATVNF